jgi:hypothetical protein
MPASTLRQAVTGRLTAFAWDQWAQLGVLATTNRRDDIAADPEALLLLTFEAGRSDPRLFDEALDWLRTNWRLISVQRLRNLCREEEDRDLVEGALLWVARHEPRFRVAPLRRRQQRANGPRPLFYDVAQNIREPDESFRAVGWLKPPTNPSAKSRPPDPSAPINFAFRMRYLFALGTRSEILRYLVTAPVADASALAIADAAAYAKRNVNETLTSLVASSIVTAYEHGNERRYYLDRPAWGQFLGFEQTGWPAYRDWPRLLGAVRRLSRWLHDPALDGLTPYMLASTARTVAERLTPDLAAAGIPTARGLTLPGEEYWDTFTDIVRSSVAALDQGASPRGGAADSFGAVVPPPES